jgi:hypothetical protein
LAVEEDSSEGEASEVETDITVRGGGKEKRGRG